MHDGCLSFLVYEVQAIGKELHQCLAGNQKTLRAAGVHMATVPWDTHQLPLIRELHAYVRTYSIVSHPPNHYQSAWMLCQWLVLMAYSLAVSGFCDTRRLGDAIRRRAQLRNLSLHSNQRGDVGALRLRIHKSCNAQ
jgi:hypothetical protein